MQYRNARPVPEQGEEPLTKADYDRLAQQINALQSTVRDIKRQLEAPAPRQRAVSKEVRRAFRGGQNVDLLLYEAAFILVYHDTRITLAVLRSQSTLEWIVTARRTLAGLIFKWRPDITATDLSVLWGRHPSTIGHMRRNAGPADAVLEQQWIDALAKAGHALIAPAE